MVECLDQHQALLDFTYGTGFMETNPATIVALMLMWAVCAFAGITFLRNALMEQTPRKISKIGRIARELRFRARLMAGLLLLLWVAASLVWMLIKWL